MSRSIEWQHDGRRLVVPAIVYHPAAPFGADGVSVTALVDTGSTTSAVTTRIANRNNLRRLGKRPLGSAQGEGQAERFVFRLGLENGPPVGDAPQFPFLFDEVTGFELSDSFSLDALIGMDILSQCDFSITKSRTCRLTFG